MNRNYLSIIIILVFGFAANEQSTEFTYQGGLKDGANPANANYDFEFRLFAVVTGRSALGSLQRLAVPALKTLGFVGSAARTFGWDV